MAPKKKNNKKDDDWEAELGETPNVPAEPENKDAPAEADPEDEFPGGGLMAMMRKKQKKKKGKQTEDFVEGETPPTDDQPDIVTKAPAEASIDDEFSLSDKKKGKAAPVKAAKQEDEDEDEKGADGKVLTKAQKEKLKKEREKQRKKENVSLWCL
jgi:translation initiation factor 5B